MHLRLGNLTLDQASFELSTDAGSVRLPNKEYQMLELLLPRWQRLLSCYL